MKAVIINLKKIVKVKKKSDTHEFHNGMNFQYK